MNRKVMALKKALKSFVKHAVEQLQWGAARFSVRSKLLSGLHLLVFSRHQVHEYRAMLNGGLQFRRLTKSNRFNPYLVRRATHRLEKGLIMRPRRSVFAQDYIVELVESFRIGCETGEISLEDKAWTESVLTAYFAETDDTPITVAARKNLYATKDRRSDRGVEAPSPVRKYRKDTAALSVLERLTSHRRSVRWFQDLAVPDDVVEAAVKIAVTAPSACNRQPYNFFVRHGPDARKIGGFALGATALAHQFPCVIAVVGDLSAYSNERDRHAIYVDASLSAMQLILAFETLGIGSCVINWPDIPAKDKRIAKELKLNDYQRTVMLIAIGYPVAEQLVPYSAKRAASEVIIPSGDSV